MPQIRTLELCAGAGGQALGLEQAGIEHAALVEIDHHVCATLRLNRPQWNVIREDIRNFDAAPYPSASS
jgi:DNA (cytosine-5)-methyltransferase 1